MFYMLLGLCSRCSKKLNYKQQKKEVKRVQSKLTKSGPKRSKDREMSCNSQSSTSVQDEVPVTSKTMAEVNVWSEQLQIEDDKPRENDFEDYLEQLLF